MDETVLKIDQLEREVAELKLRVDRRDAQQIQLPVDFTSKGILENVLVTIKSSTKLATSEQQAVNESGIGVYNVMPPCDLFLQIILNNTTYYIPVFT